MADNTLEYLIDVAIKNEEEAYNFYMDLFSRQNDREVKETLKFLADEEKRHKEFLVSYRQGKYEKQSLKMSTTVDYKIAEHVAKPDLQKDVKTKDVYLVAAHRELNSYNFYKGLADIQPAGEVKDMLLRMANEEMKHKEKVEYLYSNTAFTQISGG